VLKPVRFLAKGMLEVLEAASGINYFQHARLIKILGATVVSKPTFWHRPVTSNEFKSATLPCTRKSAATRKSGAAGVMGVLFYRCWLCASLSCKKSLQYNTPLIVYACDVILWVRGRRRPTSGRRTRRQGAFTFDYIFYTGWWCCTVHRICMR
jgi:hypothetical protein